MSDNAAGDYASLAGQEIVNSARTIAYLQAGYGPPTLDINAGCSCNDIRTLAGCDPDPYTIPSDTTLNSLGTGTKAAPWFDPSVPESADFAGFYPTSFKGMDATYTRQSFPRISGGSVVGRQRAQERILTWQGFLFGRTCCAVQFGLRWLTTQLTGISCDCDTEDLDVMVCCPQAATGVTNCQGLPSVQFGRECNQPNPTAFNAFRTLHDVALIEGPKILSERKTGCSGGCTTSMPCAAESCIIEVEFSLIAGNPFLHGCPQTICANMHWPAGTQGSCGPDTKTYGTGPLNTTRFKKTTTKDATTGLLTCPSVNCNPADDCTLDENSLCRPPTLPSILPPASVCAVCDPLDPQDICCFVNAADFGEFFELVPVIEIYAGRKAMRNTSIKFYNDPLERPCSGTGALATEDCNVCDSVVIRYIPPEGTLVIDGVNRSITLKCKGNEAGSPGDSLTVSPFSWTILQCVDTCICITTDGIQVDTTSDKPASVTITAVPRQM